MILKQHKLQFWVGFYFLCHIFNLFSFYCSFYFPMLHYCFFLNVFFFLLVCFFLCIFFLNSFYYFKVFITGHPEALEYFFSNCLLPDEGWYIYQVIKRETAFYFKKFIYLHLEICTSLFYFFGLLSFLFTIPALPPFTIPATSISLTSGLKSFNGMSSGFPLCLLAVLLDLTCDVLVLGFCYGCGGGYDEIIPNLLSSVWDCLGICVPS